MNWFRDNALLRSRYPLAVLAGLVLAAAFPKIGIAGLAWVAPALMLAAALGKRGAESLRIGYVAGLAYHLALLYWLLLIPYRWHGVPLGPAAGWLSLSAYLALYPAAWVWFMAGVQRRRPKVESRGEDRVARVGGEDGARPPQPATESVVGSQRSVEGGAGLGATWMGRTLWALSGAAAWVALEMVQGRLFSGFPWDPLGVSQYQMVPLIQVAALTGVHGVSFLVVWASLSLLTAARMALKEPTRRSVWVSETFLPILVVALTFSFGLRRVGQEVGPVRTLKVTMVQPSIPQTLIWDTAKDTERFLELIRLSARAMTNQTDLLVWPESAVPSYARWDTNICPAITNFVRGHRIWLILGSDDLGVPAHRAGTEGYEYYNASFLIDREGEFVARYKKQHLVVFGEYIPLMRWLPFLEWFTPIQGGFTAGTRPVPFKLPDLKVKTSVLICFEDIFPGLARECAEPDTDFLVNLTNDGWFGESAAQWQHAAAAIFRAVENGLPLLRCANNGLTCWVDGHGRVRQVACDPQGSVYGSGFMTAKIPLLAPGERRGPTFYHEHGDWLGWGCVGISGIVLALRIRRRNKGV